jgi:glycosyltransferase involved in cell wall biosynthesis
MEQVDEERGPRIGILVVAYNAASTLARVLDRIPADFRPRISDVLICDNNSEDSTYLVGLGYRHKDPDLPITVVRNPRNVGYGGNQKVGYRWAIEHGLDIVVLLHADGQYAPEFLPQIVAPLERGEADAVFGSRMMQPGGARAGGMPLYKFVGNKVLTAFENSLVGLELSEWHSGYRAYRVDALRDIPFEANTDEYHFDTHIIVQRHEAGKRIVELPIPTYYGDEVSYVNGIKYARDIVGDILRYRLHKMGLGSGEAAFASAAYDLKTGPSTSHGRILAWLRGLPPCRVLVLGPSAAELGARVRDLGHEVTGAGPDAPAKDALDHFVEADLDAGLPADLGGPFEVVALVEVLEQVREPERLLGDVRTVLAPGGTVVTAVSNFGHWYPRARVAAGLFDYDRRGILDRNNVRFFTRRTFERLAHRTGFAVLRRESLGPPIEVLARGLPGETERPPGRGVRAVHAVDSLGVVVRPTLFAYQFVYELRPADPATADG